MHDWISSLPKGTVVVGSAFNEAMNGMDLVRHTALGLLGAALSTQIKWRESYVLIGMIGDRIGRAIEDHGTDPTIGLSEVSGGTAVCTKRGTDISSSYAPRPSGTLVRTFFRGRSGQALSEEFGRRQSAEVAQFEMATIASSEPYLSLELQSAGACAGNIGTVNVQGRAIPVQDCVGCTDPNNRRGLFVVTIRKQGAHWRVNSATVYDTFASDDAAAELANFIEALEDRTVIAMVLYDAAFQARKTPGHVKLGAALAALGSKLWAKIRFRESWAFATLKDTESDATQPVEDFGRMDPVPANLELINPKGCHGNDPLDQIAPRPTEKLAAMFLSSDFKNVIAAAKPYGGYVASTVAEFDRRTMHTFPFTSVHFHRL